MAAHKNLSGQFDDYDEDDEPMSKDERESQEAYAEYSKISPEEMDRRHKQWEATKKRLWSPEYLEEARLKRVKMNKGKETTRYNADGTLKETKK
jgi:hypothetical protein